MRKSRGCGVVVTEKVEGHRLPESPTTTPHLRIL